MDSNLNTQLDQLSLGDSEKSFDVKFQLPPLAPSFPPSDPSLLLPAPSTPSSTPSTSILSLPPELISEIFEEIPLHPSSKRNSTLTSLCLVNHLFLDLARPLLYRSVRLSLTVDLGVGPSSWAVFSTLSGSLECAKLVRVLRLVFEEPHGLHPNALEYLLLMRLQGLETVRAGWDEIVTESMGQKIIETVIKSKPHLPHLEIPWIILGYETQDAIFSELGHLRTFIGAPPDRFRPEDHDELFPNVSCRLNRLVLRSSVEPLYLNRLLSLSHHTLTALCFTIAPESSKSDLSSFTNLTLLRICVEDRNPSRLFQHNDPSFTQKSRNDLSRDLLNLLRSVQGSPLQTLALWGENKRVGEAIAEIVVNEMALPQSLIHFAGTLPFLSPISSLVKAIRTKSLPRLQRVSILPDLGNNDSRGRAEHLERLFSEFHIRLHSLELAEEWLEVGGLLDPYLNESDTDEDYVDEAVGLGWDRWNQYYYFDSD